MFLLPSAKPSANHAPDRGFLKKQVFPIVGVTSPFHQQSVNWCKRLITTVVALVFWTISTSELIIKLEELVQCRGLIVVGGCEDHIPD